MSDHAPFARHLAILVCLLSAIECGAQATLIDSIGPRAAPPRDDFHTSELKTKADIEAAPMVATFDLAIASRAESLLGRNVDPFNPAIGFGRPVGGIGISNIVQVPASVDAVRVRVRSPGATHLRIGLRFPDAREYSLLAYAPGASERAVASKRSASEALVDAPTWTPVTDGSTQELLVRRAEPSSGPWSFTVESVSHIDEAIVPTDSPMGPKAAASCQVDVACLYATAPAEVYNGLSLAEKAVAKMVFTRAGGGSYLCTGTLLNSAKYPLPFFLTAAHCIADQVVASSLVTYWHYQRDTCNIGGISPSMKQLAGGATLLYTNSDADATLLGLNFPPPSGASYSGWRANGVDSGTPMLAIHHPDGDVKIGSFGTVLGPTTGTTTISGKVYAAGTFDVVSWQLGIVQGGSSGSGLFTYDNAKGFFYTRGTLTGGKESCTDPTSRNYYSRLLNYYPDIASALNTPLAPTNPQAIEYYHGAFGHYFVTIVADEISKLDAGVFAGWSRTGQSFNVHPLGASGTASVCRFFTTAFAPKSSHFYTPSSSECATVKANPNWTYEALVFGFTSPSAAGVCPASTQPLYRLYNNGKSGAPNHRYTTSTTIRTQMLQQGWIPEGAGSLGVIGCVPT